MAYENEITFEIIRHIGLIKKQNEKWSLEVNIVSWNGGVPKVDIREWTKDHEQMTRGITLTKEEMDAIVEYYENGPSYEEITAGYVDEGIESPLSGIVFDVFHDYGPIEPPTESGWQKRLKIMSWNGGRPKFDIRSWDPTGERMARGKTLRAEEMDALVELYKGGYCDE